MLDPQLLSGNKIALIFKKTGEEKTHFAKGRVGQTLIWLVHKGKDGMTAQEMTSWARLCSYVFILRRDFNLKISTIREPHEGGNHARYVLLDELDIVQIIPAPRE